jgi:hypothetical protein
MGLSTSDRGEVRWEAPFCRQYHWTGLIRQKVLGVSRGATIIPLHQFWCSMGVSRVHTEVWGKCEGCAPEVLPQNASFEQLCNGRKGQIEMQGCPKQPKGKESSIIILSHYFQ